MQINLTKAHRYAEQLEKISGLLYQECLELKTQSVSYVEWDSPHEIQKLINLRNEKIEGNLKQVERMYEARFALRNAIGKANHTSGISERLAEVSLINQRILFLKKFTSEPKYPSLPDSLQDIVSMLNKAKETNDFNTLVYLQSQYARRFSVLTSGDERGYDDIISKMYKLKTSLMVEVSALNDETYINVNLDPEIIEVCEGL